MAVKYDAYECFTVLLDHSANIEEYNLQDETILIVAVRLQRTQIMKDLIVKEANMRIQHRMGRTII